MQMFIKNTLWFSSTGPCNNIEFGENVIRNIHPGINSLFRTADLSDQDLSITEPQNCLHWQGP